MSGTYLNYFLGCWHGLTGLITANISKLTEGEKLLLLITGLLIVSVYLYETVKYLIKYILMCKRRKNTITLAKIKLKGDLLNTLGQEGVALALRAEFMNIRKYLNTMENEEILSYHAPAAGMDTGYCFVGLRQNAPIPRIDAIENQVFEQNIRIELGNFIIPVTDIINNVLAIVGILPVITRRMYKKSLINISMITDGKNTLLSIYRPRGYKESGIWRPSIITKTYATESLKDINNIICDAAFIILKIHGSFQKKSWQGMRYLIDSFAAFDEYRRTGAYEYRDQAKSYFREATMADPEYNFEALYYYAVMTMVERTAEAIEEACGFFKKALCTDNERLKAFIYAGLAFCYAQSFHRLGKRDPDTLSEAEDYINTAIKHWKKSMTVNEGKEKDSIQESQKTQLSCSENEKKKRTEHPLFIYTQALVLQVDEHHQDRLERFIKAANLSHMLVKLEPFNSMFANNLGWILMKLTEWGNIELTDTPKLKVNNKNKYNIPLLAEKYLQQAIVLNPKNKLSHANLCLLYSTQYFRNQSDNTKYYYRAHYNGLKAVGIDKNYINGYRDLAVAYIRYGKYNEAYKKYKKALKLADSPYKDNEIVKDINAEITQVLSDKKINKKELKRWENPDPALFEPRIKLAQD